MTELDMMTTQVGALKQAIHDERAKRDLFVKASTLDEEIQKISSDTEELREQLKDAKAKHADAIRRRDEAVRTSLGAMERRIQKMLPFGEAALNLTEDGRLVIGWIIGEKSIPYWALSGGQKMIFDPALAFAMLGKAQSKIVIMEGAEMDTRHLTETIQQIAESRPEAQIICATWHEPDGEVDGWETVKLEGSDAESGAQEEGEEEVDDSQEGEDEGA